MGKEKLIETYSVLIKYMSQIKLIDKPAIPNIIYWDAWLRKHVFINIFEK